MGNVLAAPALPNQLVRANYSRWPRGFANVQNGVSSARMLHVGDSVTWGSNASGNPPGPGGGSYPTRLATLLSTYMAPAVLGLSTPPIWGTLDTRWAPGTWAANTNYGAGAYQGVPASTDLTFTPGTNCDTFDVYYVQSAGFGGFNLTIDGGAPSTFATAGATSIQKATIVGAASAAHVLHIGTVTGVVVIIVAIEARLSTDTKVIIGNAGRIGSVSTDWSNSPVPGAGPLAVIAAYAPDLVTINLGGINDAFFGVSQSTYQAALDAIVASCLTTSDVLLITEPQSTTGYIGAYEVGAAATMRALSQKYKLGVVDILAEWQPNTKFQTLGYFSDTTHPSTLGYQSMAVSIMRGLQQIS